MHSFTTFLSLLITSSIVVLPLFPYTVFASHTGNRIHRRVELSFPHGAAHPLASSNVSLNTTNKFTTEVERKVLNKRGGSARFTWFNTGLGACGGTNSASDFIVAINKPQWDDGSHCYETVTLTYNGKSAQAQIVDECMGCPPNALDLSVGLFRFLVGPSQDEVMGDWSFGGEVKPSSTTTVEPTTSSTRTSHAVPTSTEAHTSTSVISTETSTTHRSSTVPFASMSTLTSTSLYVATPSGESTSTTTTTSATSTSMSIPSPTDYISAVNNLMFTLGNIIMQAPAAAARG